MRGRVFHAELGGENDTELLQRALKCLIDKSHEFICGLDKSQCEDLLRREMQSQAIFLAIDNMSDTTRFIGQAKSFLATGFCKESIVVVMARSLDVLKLGLLDIDESNCLEMPELLEDEAKSLFMEHAISCHDVGLEIDEEIIVGCLKRCYFKKGDVKNYHYHPLALKVLGTQLGCSKYDRNKWAATLKEVDTFNRLREEEHPIFSILRKSFDTLRREDHMLFMDVALFLPERSSFKMDMTWFEWLSMVHDTSVDEIMERLEGLKRKSLLQDLGDGRSMKIGMHDLWHEFAVMESRAGEFEGRRWVYEVGSWSALEEGSPSGGCWQKMKRMCFLEKGLESAKQISFDHFSNITVMKMVHDRFALQSVNLRIDIQKLKHLKSMELFYVDADVVGLGLVENLRFLNMSSVTLSKAIDDIGHLTNLRVLVLVAIKGERVPNVSNLISLEEVHFSSCSLVTTISGFSSRLSKLRILNLSGCRALRSLDPGVGDLVALQELRLFLCLELEELPSLQKLNCLRALDIRFCGRIKSVPGLDNLVALEQLEAFKCIGIEELPNLQKLTRLRTISIKSCSGIESVPGLDTLISLEQLYSSDCPGIVELPNIQKLTKLLTLDISQCYRIRSLPGLDELVALQQLRARGCCGLAKLSDMGKLKKLEVLDLWGCPLESAPGMGVLIALEELAGDFRQLPQPQEPDLLRYSLLVDLCMIGYSYQEVFMGDLVSLSKLEKLRLRDCSLGDKMADCQSLNRLKVVEIDGCDVKDVSGLSSLTALETLKITGCHELEGLPNLLKLSSLEVLSLEKCNKLKAVYCRGSLSKLKIVRCRDLPVLKELPDLGCFPGIREFCLGGCAELRVLKCTGPLVKLSGVLTLTACPELISVPDMSHFPTLSMLEVIDCDHLEKLTGASTSLKLKTIKLTGRPVLSAIPDLSNFPELRILQLENCKSIVELTCSVALTSLHTMKLTCCGGLKAIPDLGNFQGLKILQLIGGESIVKLTCSSKPLEALEELNLDGCRSLDELPDLSGSLRLKVLRLGGCRRLMKLTCISPLAFLEELDLGGCSSLSEIPNLVNDFSQLKVLSGVDLARVQTRVLERPVVRHMTRHTFLNILSEVLSWCCGCA